MQLDVCVCEQLHGEELIHWSIIEEPANVGQAGITVHTAPHGTRLKEPENRKESRNQVTHFFPFCSHCLEGTTKLKMLQKYLILMSPLSAGKAMK